jgi:hypothetical protein
MAPSGGRSRTLCAGMTVLIQRTLAVLCTSLLAVGVAACGSAVSSSFKGEEHAIATVISNLQADATAGNETNICTKDLAGTLVNKLSSASGGCKQALKSQVSEVDSFVVSVKSVHINTANGQPTASALVTSIDAGKTRASTLLLTKEAGKWKISGLQ